MMVRITNTPWGNSRITVGRLWKSWSMPTKPRETAKCTRDIHSNRQGLGNTENEVELACGSERCMRERKERSRMAREKAEIKQGKGSSESSREPRGGRRSW